MKKWKENKKIANLSQISIQEALNGFFRENKEQVKKLVLPAVILFALLFFWFTGGAGDAPDSVDISYENPTAEMGAENAEISGDGNFADTSGENAAGQRQIYVDLGGEVAEPGVYQVTEGTRLFQVIEKAGGLKESADTDSINQAEAVADGQKIIIGSRDASSPYYTGTASASGTAFTSGTSAGGSSAVRETENGPVVNINLAGLTELQLLPGVGPSTAQKILDYRQQNGNFSRIEDIKNISGIGEKTFENLRDSIEI